MVEAAPDPGHEALAHLERRIPDFTLVTQNNRRPAHEGEQPDVVELHGNILRSKCSLEGEVAEPEEYDDCVPPRCLRCSGFLRPEVAWFGEMMPPGTPEAASEAARGCECSSR